MTSTKTLSAGQLRVAICTFGELLRSHKEVINRLNVYPVPDGDTGTNMALTIQSVITELEGLDSDATMESVSRAISHGSLMGARGNSGVILSQLLRGLVEKFPREGEVDPELLAESFEHADNLARQAVLRPVEGTILSIARAGAEGARSDTSSLISLARAARERAKTALAYTPEQLAVLKQAGVEPPTNFDDNFFATLDKIKAAGFIPTSAIGGRRVTSLATNTPSSTRSPTLSTRSWTNIPYSRLSKTALRIRSSSMPSKNPPGRGNGSPLESD